MQLSKSQIDKLGERLKRGAVPESDLILLSEFKSLFSKPFELVTRSIEAVRLLLPFEVEVVERPEKTIQSIENKLRRESTRLSTMQDIAGCRAFVRDMKEQDTLLELLTNSLRQIPGFGSLKIDDRRDNPSHGYRAVHLIISVENRPIEIQVRTRFQHIWADFSQKIADQDDPQIKYGGGHPLIQRILIFYSDFIKDLEVYEVAVQKALAEGFDSNKPLYRSDLWPGNEQLGAKIVTQIKQLRELVGTELTAANTVVVDSLSNLLVIMLDMVLEWHENLT